MLLRCLVVTVVIFSAPACAQQTQTFSKYFQGLSAAATPLSGSESTLVLQAGLAKQIPSNQVVSGGITLGNYSASLLAGPAVPVVGASMASDWVWGTATDRASASNEAGLWNAKIYNGITIAKSFNSSNNSSIANNGPNQSLFVYGENDGVNNDVVALLADANVKVNSQTVFGANLIARSNGGGLTNVKLVGMEIDVEPAAGDTLSSQSAGLLINSYSTTLPVAIQIGSLSGGAYTNYIIAPGFAVDGAGQITGTTSLNIKTSSSGSPTLRFYDTTVGGWVINSSGSFGPGDMIVGTVDTSGGFVATEMILDRSGNVTFTGGITVNGSARGVTQTCTVNQAKTLTFTLGILTGGSCNT